MARRDAELRQQRQHAPVVHVPAGRQINVAGDGERHGGHVSSRCLSPGSTVTLAPAFVVRWIPGTRPGMTLLAFWAADASILHTGPSNAARARSVSCKVTRILAR